jgi:hypothetical protein
MEMTLFYKTIKKNIAHPKRRAALNGVKREILLNAANSITM